MISGLFKTIIKVRGGTLFSEGEPTTGVYLVRSGEFKLYKKIYTEAQSFD